MNLLSALFCVPLFIVACNHAETSDQKLKKALVGEWHNVYLKIRLNTIENTDSSSVTETDSASWELETHMKPITTFFSADGTYRSEYRTLKDSLFRTANGSWQIKNDTIVMDQVMPKQIKYYFKTSVNGSLAEFSGLIDFDEDGKADDEYLGRQRKR